MNLLRIIILFLTCSSRVYSAQTYTISDLEILHQQKSHSEYFDHFLDVRPSQRDAKWSSMTLDMANGLIKSHSKKEIITPEIFNKLLAINSQSILKNDDFFQLQFAKFALLYFQQCSQKSTCHKQLRNYWSASKRFEEVDIKIFNVSKKIAPSYSKSILMEIINSKSGNFLCRKIDIQKEIVELIIEGEKFSNSCIKEMRDEIFSQIKSSKSNIHRSTLISNLITANAFEAQTKATSLVLYLLYDPIEGDIFNYAWSELEMLSRNYPLRKSVVDTIFSIEPFPDSIIRKVDTNKRDIIINYINKNIPEYFQTYARECVAYYEGDKKFTRGIPAINCDRFFSIAKEKDWISQSLITKYNKAKKI